MRQKIIKPAPYQFNVLWDDKKYERDILELNFQPIIKTYNLVSHFVLLHWQAKPFGLRRWGVYDGWFDQYYGVDAQNLSNESLYPAHPLQIDELVYSTKPTAMILINQSVALFSEDKILIQNAAG